MKIRLFLSLINKIWFISFLPELLYRIWEFKKNNIYEKNIFLRRRERRYGIPYNLIKTFIHCITNDALFFLREWNARGISWMMKIRRVASAKRHVTISLARHNERNRRSNKCNDVRRKGGRSFCHTGADGIAIQMARTVATRARFSLVRRPNASERFRLKIHSRASAL